MEDTICKYGECKFIKFGLCDSCADCPNYVESWWQSKDGTPKLVKDCYPKRSLLMEQEIINRLLSLQSANEQSRNEFTFLSSTFRQVIEGLAKANEFQKISKVDEKSLLS